MFHKLKRTLLKQASLEKQRQAISSKSFWPQGIQRYLSSPLPGVDDDLDALQFLALDFETTGLDPTQDQILSIGYVPMTLSHIDVAQASEIFIAHGQYIKADSAQINLITPQMLVDGQSLEAGFSLLFEALVGKVLLVHGASIERNFINAYFKFQLGLAECPLCLIDTLALEKDLSYLGQSGAHRSYQLDDLRRHYGLPEYAAHSAASDALACAELFMVQCKKLNLSAQALLKRGYR